MFALYECPELDRLVGDYHKHLRAATPSDCIFVSHISGSFSYGRLTALTFMPLLGKPAGAIGVCVGVV
jgi:hypothetical protein